MHTHSDRAPYLQAASAMVKTAVSSDRAETLFIKLETILANLPQDTADSVTVGLLNVIGELAG